MAEVTAVRQVIRAHTAREELEDVCGFVAGTTGGIEDRLFRLGALELLGNNAKSLLPADGAVMAVAGGAIVEHRLSNSTLLT